MQRLFFATSLFALAATLSAQMAGTPPQNSSNITAAAAPAKHAFPKGPKDAAPGGAPDKVWVNLNSAVYHCPGGRYYGKTSNGRYMTEAAAKSAGAKGPGGKTCFAK